MLSGGGGGSCGPDDPDYPDCGGGGGEYACDEYGCGDQEFCDDGAYCYWNYADWLFGTTERYWNSLAVAYDYYTIAFYLLDYEDTWCSLVNSGLGCVANDMLLPTGTQQYTGAQHNVAVPASWDHRREWRDGGVMSEVRNQVIQMLQSP